MYITELIKSTTKKEGLRDLRLYRKCNFIRLYQEFSETYVNKYESIELRRRWKALLLEWDWVNDAVWRLSRMRRRVTEWGEFEKKEAYEIVFRLLLKMKELYCTYLNLINYEIPIWQNIIITIIRAYSLDKDEIYEILPSTKIESLKLVFRQTFQPVIRVLEYLESKLLRGEVDETKLNEFEEMMLISVLPFFEDVYKEMVRRQEARIW